MGCDIHLYVETRHADGTWKTADKWKSDEYDEDSNVLTVDYKDQFYSDRNYNLFSILADVRNGSGFAGVKTGEGFNVIAPPRGVPADACPEYLAYQKEYGCGGHSHGYLTVAEIMAFDWTQTTMLCGWVSPTSWARWRDYGSPDDWCGEVGGRDVRHFDASDFEAAWQKLRAEREYPETRYAYAHLNPNRDEGRDIARFVEILGGGSPYTHVSWQKQYYECCKDFLGTTMPRLWALGEPEDVRITFFFDN